MKMLWTVAFAALSVAALAQDPAAPCGFPREAPRAPHRPPCGKMECAERGCPEKGCPAAECPKNAFREGLCGNRAACADTEDPLVDAALNPRIADRLGLSDEIQLEIKRIDLETRSALRDLQQKTRQAMKRQADLLKAEKPDESAVMAAIDELFRLRAEMAKVQTRRILAVKALLTPEQIEKALGSMSPRRFGARGMGPRAFRRGGPVPPPPVPRGPAPESEGAE